MDWVVGAAWKQKESTTKDVEQNISFSEYYIFCTAMFSIFLLADSVLLSLFKLDKNCILFCHLDYVLIHTEFD